MKNSMNVQEQLISPNESRHQRSLIVVAKATRKPDDSADIENTVIHCHTPVPLQALTMGRMAKQPHHKLPLKMILSEVARRGEDDTHFAAMPGDKQLSTTIDDIFTKPPDMDRIEYLTHPRDLGKKRKRKPFVNIMERNSMGNAEMIKQHCSRFNQSKNMSNLKRKAQSSEFEEDPLIPNHTNVLTNPSEDALTSTTPYSSASSSSSYGPVTPDSLSINDMLNRKDINRNIQGGNFSTPFSKSRFMHLYGNEGNKQSLRCQHFEPLSTSQKPVNYVDLSRQHVNYSPIEPKSAALQIQTLSNRDTGYYPIRSSPAFSSSDNFLQTINHNEKRKYTDDFIWQPKYFKAGSEKMRKMSTDHLGSIEEGDEDTSCLFVSNYSYEVREYNVTIESQESEMSILDQE